MLVMESNTVEEALQYLQKNDAGDHLNLGVALGVRLSKNSWVRKVKSW